MSDTVRIERRIKLHHLNVMMAIAKFGSMGKAAAHLNTTQPSISRAMAELEHALGVPLLDRTNQGVEPTIYGRAILDCGTAVVDELTRGIRNIKFLADPTEGELNIAGDSPSTAGGLPATIRRFQRRYPNVDVHVQVANEASQQALTLRERRCDLAFVRLPEVLDAEFESETLYHDPVLIVASTTHPLAKRRKIGLPQLVGQRWALPTPGSVIGQLVDRHMRSIGLEFPSRGIVTGSLHMDSILVASGDFLGFFPGSLMHFAAKSLGLKALPVDLKLPSSPFGIMRLKARTLGPIAKAFIQHARETAKHLA